MDNLGAVPPARISNDLCRAAALGCKTANKNVEAKVCGCLEAVAMRSSGRTRKTTGHITDGEEPVTLSLQVAIARRLKRANAQLEALIE